MDLFCCWNVYYLNQVSQLHGCDIAIRINASLISSSTPSRGRWPVLPSSFVSAKVTQRSTW